MKTCSKLIPINIILIFFDTIQANERRQETSSPRWESDKDWFWPFEPILKLKTTFCKYWTSTKISREYEGKTKMTEEQMATANHEVSIGLHMKTVV